MRNSQVFQSFLSEHSALGTEPITLQLMTGAACISYRPLSAEAA